MSRVKQVSFNGTSGYTFTVPKGYSPTVSIDVAGGSGGQGGHYYSSGGGGAGGHAGKLTGTLTLAPGDKVDVYIGEGGKQGNYSFNGGAGGRAARIGNYNGNGTVYPVTLSYAWSQFMNNYAVWVNPDGVSPVNQTVSITRVINIPYNGSWRFSTECDNYVQVYIDDNNIINTAGFTNYYADSVDVYLTAGQHILKMDVTNWGGPAGVALVIGNDQVTLWTTRSVLNPNPYTYWFNGGTGGNTYADGGYIYPGPGGGGGATAIFVNDVLTLVAAGGGGGGAEGGHGAGGTAGSNGGSPNRLNPNGTGNGANGTDGSDIGGTPGGGGGYIGGDQGDFIYYDDAPSGGASGGTNYNARGSFTPGIYAGGGSGNGLNGYCTFSFTELGSGKVKVNGQWKQITNNFVKVNGRWKEIANAWVKANGVWKVVSGGADIATSQISGNYG